MLDYPEGKLGGHLGWFEPDQMPKLTAMLQHVAGQLSQFSKGRLRHSAARTELRSREYRVIKDCRRSVDV